MQFTVIDAGYTATDYAIVKVLADPSCNWISLSNGDNAYGSRVVENVLHGENVFLSCGVVFIFILILPYCINYQFHFLHVD